MCVYLHIWMEGCIYVDNYTHWEIESSLSARKKLVQTVKRVNGRGFVYGVFQKHRSNKDERKWCSEVWKRNALMADSHKLRQREEQFMKKERVIAVTVTFTVRTHIWWESGVSLMAVDTSEFFHGRVTVMNNKKIYYNSLFHVCD